MKLRAKDFPEYYRDPQTNGIVHDSNDAYQEYLKRKIAQKRQNQEKQQTEARLNNLENEISQLKCGINQILELLKDGTKNTPPENS